MKIRNKFWEITDDDCEECEIKIINLNQQGKEHLKMIITTEELESLASILTAMREKG